jgi:excisionase family DNA binding protein
MMQLSLGALSNRGLTRAELVTSHELAELVGVPGSTVRQWGRKGRLPCVELGRHVRYVRSHVLAAEDGGARDRGGWASAT